MSALLHKTLRQLARHPSIGIALLYAFTATFDVFLLPPQLHLHIEYPLGIALLFFFSLEYWPLIALFSTGLSIANGAELSTAMLAGTSAAFVAVAGAHALRWLGVDPIFRHKRDMLYTIAVALAVAIIPPTMIGIDNRIHGLLFPATTWFQIYIAYFTTILVALPFMLRWYAKPRFARTLPESFDIGLSLAAVTAIIVAWRMYTIPTLWGVPLIYILIIPLFWIALRHRPRFITLALFITYVVATLGTFYRTPAAQLAEAMTATHLFVSALAIGFFIIVTQEEDRRVNENIMLSQLNMLENLLAKTSSESKAKNNFIAMLAHELRNPLAPVVSHIEIMKYKGARDQEESEALNIMSSQLENVKRLLDDLLDISRISEGKISIKKERIDMGTILNGAIAATNHLRLERHQHLSYKKHTQPLYVLGDRLRLEQVFSNLLSNASKYSNSGDTITVEVLQKERSVAVKVKDEGIGLEEDSVESIFLPFNQLEEGGRSTSGLGIGLALVRNFVELHGGHVQAASNGKNKGSVFTVELPLYPSLANISSTSTLQGDAVAPTIGQRILVVDDNDVAAGGIARLLELHGCSVQCAYNADQALKATVAFSPQLILLDMQLPDQSGPDVAKTLRQRGFTGRIVGLSGYTLPPTPNNQLDEELFSGYLVKPVGLQDLRSVFPEIS